MTVKTTIANLEIGKVINISGTAVFKNQGAEIGLPTVPTTMATTDTSQILTNKTVIGDPIHIVSASALSYGDPVAPSTIIHFPVTAPALGQLLAITSVSGGEIKAGWQDGGEGGPANQLATSTPGVLVGVNASTPSVGGGQILITTDQTTATWQNIPPSTALKAGAITVDLSASNTPTVFDTLVFAGGSAGVWRPPPPLDAVSEILLTTSTGAPTSLTTIPLTGAFNYVVVFVGFADSTTGQAGTSIFRSAYKNFSGGAATQIGQIVSETFTDPEFSNQAIGVTLTTSGANLQVSVDQKTLTSSIFWTVKSSVVQARAA